MSSKKLENKKMISFSFKRFLNSFKYSYQGLKYAYRNEQSLLLHLVSTIVAIILGIILKISFKEWAVVLLALVEVLSVELVNTAIEAAVDLTTDKIHPLAKIAKDCGSAATFVSAIAAVIICLFIFIPHFINIL